MKFQNRSTHVIFFENDIETPEFSKYSVIPHSAANGDIEKIYTARFNVSNGSPRFIKVPFKGTKPATIIELGASSNSYALTLNPSVAPSKDRIQVQPNQNFYIGVTQSNVERMFIYTDADGTSPLFCVSSGGILAEQIALGEYIIEGYSNGTNLSSIPDSMDSYEPDLAYYPKLEITRDWINSSQYGSIPSEFKKPFRIECSALLPNDTIPEGTSYLAPVYDRLRSRIYLPFENLQYAVITQLSKGMPIDVGWNCKEQRLVCLYAREVVQYNLVTGEVEVLYSALADDPDFHAMYVGTLDNYSSSVFIGFTSTSFAVRLYKRSNGANWSTFTSRAKDGETFTYPPTAYRIPSYKLPKSDAFLHSQTSEVQAILNNKVGYAEGFYGDVGNPTTPINSRFPIVLDAISHGTVTHSSHSEKSYDGDMSSASFLTLYYNETLGKYTALPISTRIFAQGMQDLVWETEELGGSIPFDTVVFKSGESCPDTTDYHRRRQLNPLVTIYAELYPELPNRYRDFRNTYVSEGLRSSLNLSGLAEVGDSINVPTIPDWQPTSYTSYPSYFQLDAGTSLSVISDAMNNSMTASVINRKTGEVKVNVHYLTQVNLDVTNNRVYSETSGGSAPYKLTMPRGDDEDAAFDIELLSFLGYSHFRRIDYGHRVSDPEFTLDYIRAARVDKLHWSNEIDMTPVSDGVIIVAKIPKGVRVYIHGDVYRGGVMDDNDVLLEDLTLQCDNTYVFQFEVTSPPTYDARLNYTFQFNGTVETLVIETPPIQGAVVDGLTTATTQKSVASICDHHQQTLVDAPIMDYIDYVTYGISNKMIAALKHVNTLGLRPHDFFKALQPNKLIDNAIIPVYTPNSISAYPKTKSKMLHENMSILTPSNKIDFVYTAASMSPPKYSVDWIHVTSPSKVKRAMNQWEHVSSPLPHSRAMNYWEHVSSPLPHKRPMNYWEIRTQPRPNLRRQNTWVVYDNLNHISVSMANRFPPVHSPKVYYSWLHDWVHTFTPHHSSKPRFWFHINPPELTFTGSWVHTVKFDPVTAYVWISKPVREFNLFNKEWKKDSNITKYTFDSLDAKHKYVTYDFDVYGMMFTQNVNLLIKTLPPQHIVNFYSVHKPLTIVRRNDVHNPHRGNFSSHSAKFHSANMPTREILIGEGSHVVYKDKPQGYYATEELAYQAAIDAGYDPDVVLIMVQQYYPNAWIFSIRFKRVGICAKAVEYGYVRGG